MVQSGREKRAKLVQDVVDIITSSSDIQRKCSMFQAGTCSQHGSHPDATDLYGPSSVCILFTSHR